MFDYETLKTAQELQNVEMRLTGHSEWDIDEWASWLETERQRGTGHPCILCQWPTRSNHEAPQYVLTTYDYNNDRGERVSPKVLGVRVHVCRACFLLHGKEL
jgi:hypothetical protein